VNTKWDVALKSALRALIPILIALASVYRSGGLHTWQDWTLAIVAAVLGKGISAAATAKNVTLQK